MNFGRLPLELREEIWRYALKEERVVEIIWKRTENRWWAAGTNQVPAPGLFPVCKESNTVAKANVVKCFGAFINLESDPLWVNSLKYDSWAQHFLEFADEMYNIAEIQTIILKRN